MSRANIVGQLSLFDTPPAAGGVSATCLWEYDPQIRSAEPASAPMKRMVPAGEYVVQVGDRSLVLVPTGLRPEDVPEGHRYYHYQVGGRVYSGVFVVMGEVA